MARAPRLALAGELHHLMQRGHNRQTVFADDLDRKAYLTMLRDAAAHCAVSIHAYALLNTEVHLLATPNGAASLARLMQSLGRRYVAAFNRRHGRSGTLWEGRFRASVIDAVLLGQPAIVYIETAAIRAGLVSAAVDWPWSSADHHLGLRRDPVVTEHPAYWALGNTPFDRESAHAHKLEEGVSRAQTDLFERAVMRGRTAGSGDFAMAIEKRTGLPQHSRPRGRPVTRSPQSGE